MRLTLTHDGRKFINCAADELTAAGVPPGVIDAAFAALRQTAVSNECRNRIYASVSKEAQSNIATASALIAAKDANVRSEGELQILAVAGDLSAWVADMRATSEALTADEAADYTDASAWPAVPTSLAGLVAQF
jgi:hypothetical protein